MAIKIGGTTVIDDTRNITNISNISAVGAQFTGSTGLQLPSGTTAQRPNPAVAGQLRYNTDLGLIEVFTPLGWQGIDSPPFVSNFSGRINENTSTNITVIGTGFKNGSIVSITGPGVNNVPRALSTTFVSGTQLTAATNATQVNYVGGAAFNIQVTNTSGLGGELAPAGFIDRDPLWSTAAGNLGTIRNLGETLTVQASDPDGQTPITYSLVSGSLPAGATLNSTTGVISGFNLSESATSTFTLRATEGTFGEFADRQFSITVEGPLYTFTTVTFTGITGNTGPSLAQARSGMTGTPAPSNWNTDTSYFNTSSGRMLWTVPQNATYRIECFGAQGGTGGGGLGARVRGDHTLTRGTVLVLLVGQTPANTGGDGAAHGGGGTGVYFNSNNTILIAAGGGGGRSGGSGGSGAGQGGLLTTSGGSKTNAPGGTNGGGGCGGFTPGDCGFGGGGGGFTGDGQGGSTGGSCQTQTDGMRGRRGLNDGRGSFSTGCGGGGVGGGFGLGGGGQGNWGGGGGGGYSGGAGSQYTGSGAGAGTGGAGGGSFISGDNQSNTAATRSGGGAIIITRL
jgi:hypothetical protein